MRDDRTVASYVELERCGDLARRERLLWDLMRGCRLCPRRCGADRPAGELGACGAGATVAVASAGPHPGEEPPLSGTRGSGTVFFSGCNLACIFCQNHDIAHAGQGTSVSHAELAEIMLDLQRAGCHNINLVTPTHVVPFIVSGVRIAAARGLRLPLVYNCGGYESLDVIRLLDGIVDIYLPDFKFQDGATAARLTAAGPDYPTAAAAAILEMHRQVGPLRVDDAGIAVRGLLVRHLVLPNDLAGTDAFARWAARALGTDAVVNIMEQYRPAFLATGRPELARRPTAAELARAAASAMKTAIRRLL